jgi:TP901-1 family phage major tail protein
MAVSGQDASITVGGTDVLGMNELSVTVNGETIDVTTFASGGWMEKIQGLKSAELSISGFWLASDTGQDALRTALLNGTAVTMQALLDGTNGWTGDFLVTSVEESSPVADAITLSVSFESSGAITEV